LSSEARSAEAKRAFVLYVPALIATAAVLYAGTVMVDGDTYIHVAAGQWILSHAQLIHADPFSYTFAGAKWDAPEWLSEVLMACAYRLAGWSAVAGLYAVAVGLTALILARRLLEHLKPIPSIIVVLLAIACMASGLSSRPYVLALPALAFWTDQLIDARETNERPGLWLLPLMTLWTNLHASFLFGLVLVVPFAAEAFFAEKSNRGRVLRAWCVFALGALAASLINPNGIYGLIDPIKFMMRPVLASIGDWQSSVFTTFGPFEISLLALYAFLVLKPIRISFIRLSLLILILHMALSQRRHVSVFAIETPMLLAGPVASSFSQPKGEAPVPNVAFRRYAAAFSLALNLAFLAGRFVVPNTPPENTISPTTALSHVPASIAAQPVLNQDVEGGFLIWHGIKPFIDTRVELFDEPFQQNNSRLYEPDRSAILKTLARYHIGWTILPPNGPLNAMLDTLPGWRVLYADKNAVVHARTDGAASPDPSGVTSH
jgi:hypothetical protein